MAVTTVSEQKSPFRPRTVLLAAGVGALVLLTFFSLSGKVGLVATGLFALGVGLPLALFGFGAAWFKATQTREGDLPVSRLLDLLHDGLVLAGPDGRVVRANRWYRRLCRRLNVSPRMTPEGLLEILATRNRAMATELRAVGYRLSRRREAGETHAEEVALPLGENKLAVRITIRPADEGRALWVVTPVGKGAGVSIGATAADMVDSMTSPAVFLGPETTRTNHEFEQKFGQRLDETTRAALFQRMDSAAWSGGGDLSWPARPLTVPGLPPLRPARLLVEGGALYIFGGVALDLPAPPGADVRMTKALARVAEILEVAPVGVAFLDDKGRVRQCNRTFREFTSSEVETGTPLADLFDAEEGADIAPHIEDALKGVSESDPVEVRTHSTPKRVGQMIFNRMTLSGRAVTIAFVIDQTDQRSLELQFAQSQKMQAIGQLAGGVAHDFNNLLTAIIGHCDLLLMRHSVADPSFKDINQVKQNATRAANLTRQLLAFSRKQTMHPKELQLTDILADLSMLLRRLLGDNVNLDVVHARDLWPVKADQGQLEQVIINLAVNARDAMPDGGSLTVTTRNVSERDCREFNQPLMPAADYVMIEVKDTGSGIPDEILDKIFEPFFTTKGVGEGTGLGLSMVYGIIKQTGGYIFPESELGKGTAFRIFLPREVVKDTAKPERKEARDEARDITGKGNILLVEDEDAVRAFAVKALQSRGYTVHEASGGDQALQYLKDQSKPVDLVVSDVMMPVMDGPTMMRQAREIRPDLRVIFISGYAENALDDELLDGADFLPKPFTLKQLAGKVKDVLNAA